MQGIIRNVLTDSKRRLLFLLGICVVFIAISYFTGFDLPFVYRAVAVLILFLIFGSIPALNKYETLFRAVTLFIVFFANSINEAVFVGNPIAYQYIGEDAGTLELYLYDDNRCKICYGGLFGVHEQFYGKYSIEGHTIKFDIADKLLDLKGRTIEVNKRKYTIEENR